MSQCKGCGEDVAEEFCIEPRLPCPHCGATARIFTCDVTEHVEVSDSTSWVHMRPAEGGSATLDSDGNLGLTIQGQPPRNESGADVVAARLIRKLNAQGASWTEPVPGLADVDALATSSLNPDEHLSIQVIRANADGELWKQLAREGTAAKHHDSVSAARELMAAINKKAAKYPIAQRQSLTLILDASRTPNYTFNDVHNSFAEHFEQECQACRFESVWVVGGTDELIARLDLTRHDQ
jgi:hypothetical protein